MSTTQTPAARPQPRRRGARRLVQLVITLVAVLGAVGLTAGPASAAQTCTGAAAANLCLAVDQVGTNTYHVHVGIDVHMSLAEAQEYVDDFGDPFVVRLYGDDGGDLTQFLTFVPLTGLSASAGFGLSATFDITVSGATLNEDGNNGEDELRAEVRLFDTDTNRQTGRFVSNQLSGNWG